MKFQYYTLIFLIAFNFLFVACSEDKVTDTEFGTLTGTAVMNGTNDPIENVKISTSPVSSTVFSDVNGEFVITDIPVGDYSVQAEKEGLLTSFEPISISAGASSNVIFELDDETASNSAPSTPTLDSPADDATGVSVPVTLQWTSTDVDDDALTYSVHLRNALNDELIDITDLSANSHELSNLLFGVKYFWQVKVSDGVNDTVVSPLQVFTTAINSSFQYHFSRQEANGNNVIYTSDGTGTELALTSENINSYRPKLNNAANRVAFLRTSGNEEHIFTMARSGTSITQVTSTIDVAGFNNNELNFAWSSTGDRFLYPHFDKLYLINADGTGLSLFYTDPGGDLISEVVWSESGNLIIIKTNNSQGYNAAIHLIDNSGTLISTPISGLTGALGGLDISVDENKILYTYDTSGFVSSSYRQLDNRIFIYNISGAASTDISIVNKGGGSNDSDPRFSPTEAKIIFVNSSNVLNSPKSVYTMDTNGSSRTLLFNNAATPNWE